MALLSQPEQNVMAQLVQSKTTSVVLLAADLWRTTPDWQAFDPYPLITYVLDSLSSRGLVTFRIEAAVSGSYKKGHRIDMPFDIRLTPKGWELMGYGHKTVEVGSSGRHERESAHPGDMTDYVNLAGHTYGGPIEVQTFAEHRQDYPQHTHMYGVQLTMANQSAQAKRTARLSEPTVLADPNGTGDMRGYIRITPDIEAQVLSMREVMGTAGYADIAEATGLPERTIRYVLTDLPRLRRTAAGEAKATGSLKRRVMAAVEGIGTIRDVQELRRVVGMADTEHDVMHVLHSLHTQGRIDFDERGNGMGTATVINIRLPKKGGRNRLTQEQADALPEIVRDRLPEAIEPEATTPDTPVAEPSAPEPDDEAYPLLDLLLQREKARLDGDNKGYAYITAAEAIQDIDPEQARVLMEKAKAFDVPFPSPIEAEYLRYVSHHTERKS
jgi:hypothetical protein